jgi:hypothetical protein
VFLWTQEVWSSIELNYSINSQAWCLGSGKVIKIHNVFHISKLKLLVYDIFYDIFKNFPVIHFHVCIQNESLPKKFVNVTMHIWSRCYTIYCTINMQCPTLIDIIWIFSNFCLSFLAYTFGFKNLTQWNPTGFKMKSNLGSYGATWADMPCNMDFSIYYSLYTVTSHNYDHIHFQAFCQL